MPRLYILSGPDLGRSVEVQDGATLGRAVECSVHLRDASVSRHHARLERSAEGWRIVDTESRNGVRVRGERVTAAALLDGMEFRVGEVDLRFRLAPGEPAKKAELEEIALEEEPVPEAAPSPPPPPPAPIERAAAPLDRTATSIPRPGVPELRGARVLQYHRIADREGFFASDLAQQPLWIRAGAVLLALAVFAAIFFFAFKGTSILKSHAGGSPQEAPGEPGR
jgi:hypothetical protein